MTTEQRMKVLLHGFRYLAYAFKDVVATVRRKDGTVTEFTVPGVVYSEYESGPNMFHLADWIAYTLGERNIWVGFKSATPLGRQLEAI